MGDNPAQGAATTRKRAPFNVRTRTHHRQQVAALLFPEGHAVSRADKRGRITVPIPSYDQVRDASEITFKVLEPAEAEA